MPIELMLLTVVKALAELAALFLLGQGLLYVLAGQKRDNNLVYQLFRTLTGPVIRATRAITPKFIVDRHIPYVAVLLLFWIWLAMLFGMAQVCKREGVDCRAMKERTTMLDSVPAGKPVVTMATRA
jgi:hypothetical protein